MRVCDNKRLHRLLLRYQSAQKYLSEEVNWRMSEWQTYVEDARIQEDKKGMDWYVETRKFIKMLKL